jgi:thioredoxin 1
MILLHFTADWCGPCKKIKPIIENYISEHSDVEYRAIDVDESISTAKHFNVMSIPTLVVLDGEDIINRHTGILTKTELEQLFIKKE